MAVCASMILCFGLFIHWVIAVPLAATDLILPTSAEHVPVVILDAGHGGEDCGTIGINGVYEKDLNLSMTTLLAAQLRASGVQVVETRTGDYLLYDPATVTPGHKKAEDLAGRAAFAEQYPDALFVSIHMNSFPSEKYSGLQVWYQNASVSGGQLATAIQNTVREQLQPNNHRVVKPSNGSMYLLDHVPCTSVLIECGFLTNRDECEKLSGKEYQKELSFVLFCVIMNYINTEEQGLT